MFLYLCICWILWIVMWSIWSLILALHENIETFNLTTLFVLPKCQKCKKKINWESFLPIVWIFFHKKKCLFCKRRSYITTPILEILTAILFCLIRYWSNNLDLATTLFWMVTGWILLLISICDAIRYEVNIPLIVFWEILTLLYMAFWIFEWNNLWGAAVFALIFILLYYGALYYTKLKYHSDEEWVWMWDLIISPYLWVLLYIWVTTSYMEELFCAVLIFFILTSIFWMLFYLIQNIILWKKADFLSNKMADKSLPLVPSMVLALVVVILWHEMFFNTLTNLWDAFFESLI